MDAQKKLDPYAKKCIQIKARQLLGKCGIRRQDLDDIKQDIHLDLLRRRGKYDPRKAKLTTFVQRIVRNGIANLLRDRCSKKAFLGRMCLSLDRPMGTNSDENSHGTTLGDQVSEGYYNALVRGKHRSDEQAHELVVDVRRIVAGLPDEQRVACDHLLSGKNISEAATFVGLKRGTFYGKILLPIRIAFLAAGLDGYL